MYIRIAGELQQKTYRIVCRDNCDSKKAKEGIIMESGDSNNEPQQEDGQKPLCASGAMRGELSLSTHDLSCLFGEAGVEPCYLMMLLDNTVILLQYTDR